MAMREKYLPEQRAIAVAEELAAFLRTEVVDVGPCNRIDGL
jgi:hypothetical protein